VRGGELVAVGKNSGVSVDSREVEGKDSTVAALVAEGDGVWRRGEEEGVLDEVGDLVPGTPGEVVGVTRLGSPVGVPSREFTGEREGEGETLALGEVEELKSIEDEVGSGVSEGFGEGCVAVGKGERVLWFKSMGECEGRPDSVGAKGEGVDAAASPPDTVAVAERQNAHWVTLG